MNKKIEKKVPQILDDEFLFEIINQNKSTSIKNFPKEIEQISKFFEEIDTLNLSYKNVVKIDNLIDFKYLTKLQLDNNIIQKIEGLDTLTNLISLDLSFNKIEQIEGLNNLINLTDLTLFNNKIIKIENMDTLQNLFILSLGNNQLDELNEIIVLGKLKKLKSLNLGGNNLCTKEDYKLYAAAFIPSLVYLDYQILNKKIKEESSKIFANLIEKLQKKEIFMKDKEKIITEKEEQLAVLKEAYVDCLNNGELFDQILSTDNEGTYLSQQKYLLNLYQEHKINFDIICKDLYSIGIKNFENRTLEVLDFDIYLKNAKTEINNECARKLEDFHSYKNQILKQIDKNETNEFLLNELISEYQEAVTDLWEKLMGLEVHLLDQIEDSIKEFEQNLSEIIFTFVEQISGHMNKLKDLEKKLNERVTNEIMIHCEYQKKDIFIEHDNQKEDVLDKESLTVKVKSSYEDHLIVLETIEDKMIIGIKVWIQNKITNLKSDETTRNRLRVNEINNLVDFMREEFDVKNNI